MGDGSALGRSTGRQGDLGNLSGLARARLTTDDQHRMIQQGLGDVLPCAGNGEFFRKLQTEHLGTFKNGGLGGLGAQSHRKIIMR